MSLLVANCPRCRAQNMTFDLHSAILVPPPRNLETWDRWKIFAEVFCVCKKCFRTTTFLVAPNEKKDLVYFKQGLHTFDIAVNEIVGIRGHIGPRHFSVEQTPEHLPANIEKIFKEGSACMAVNCYNAAATMFRLCLDLATKSLLLETDKGLNHNTRRNLGPRLQWLFDNRPHLKDLRDLSICIKDDGNDGAHEGTLSKADAENTLGFTIRLLERIYTEPKKVEITKQQQELRKKSTKTS